MNKTNIKYPRYHSKKLYKVWFHKQANQKINAKNVVDNQRLIPSVAAPNLHILDVLNLIKQHTLIININTIVDIEI